jgi:hypothetical protein
MLSRDMATNAMDEYVCIKECTTMESLKWFCWAIKENSKLAYLRQAIKNDFEKKVGINSKCGFLGLFVFLDYMHYRWKICLIMWSSQFSNKGKNCNIILETIVDKRLWVWHVHFQLLSGNNDLNVLDCFLVNPNFLTCSIAISIFVHV